MYIESVSRGGRKERQIFSVTTGALFSASAASALLSATRARPRESDLARAERTGIAVTVSARATAKSRKKPVGN